MLLWLLIIFAVIVCYKLLETLTYWTRRGVKQESVLDIMRGVYGVVVKNEYTVLELVQMAYDKFPELSVYGAYHFGDPMLVVKDPEIIRRITIRDFEHFTDHGNVFGAGEDRLWKKSFLASKGERWRYLRTMLSPSFTSLKVKSTFGMMSECAARFVEYFEEKPDDVSVVEIKDVLSRYCNDVIANCTCGIKLDSLKDPENEFFLMARKVAEATGFKNLAKYVGLSVCPKLCKILGIKFIQDDVAAFYTRIVSETVKLREDAGIAGADLIQLMMEARKADSSRPTLEDMTAMVLNIYFAGFDVSSTLMSFMAYELAANPDVQKRLIGEVDGSTPCYEDVKRMKYLDMVISEALRKWPSGFVLDRICNRSYNLKTPQGNLEVPKGTLMWFPINAIHHDPKYYPDPHRFDPERFKDRSGIDPKAYFPFGTGPRLCVASRLALLETKVLFCHLLSKFELVLVEGTRVPLDLDKGGMHVRAKGGLWLGLKRRSTSSK